MGLKYTLYLAIKQRNVLWLILMIWCAGMLMRELGDSDAVLPTVTSAAAEVLGIDDLTGSVAPGLRADLVLWTADPLETYQARVVSTYQAGRVIYQEGDEHTWL